MELKTFMGQVSERIQKRLGKEYQVTVVANLKNNSTRVNGIVLTQRGNRVSPTIYIDDLFTQYKEADMDMDEIEQEIMSRYERSMETVDDIFHLDMEKEECEDKIIFRLVSREWNQQWLAEMPYIPFLDMAITFHLVVGISESYMQTIRITKELQKMWGISVEMLLKLAKKNTERLLPPKICGLTEMIEKYLAPEEKRFPVAEQMNLMVVTNEIGVNGASAILYEGMMEKLAENFASNLYVVPSSIHEVIILPEKDQDTYEMFLSMLREINANFVSEDEILSNQVYLYVRKEKKFI